MPVSHVPPGQHAVCPYLPITGVAAVLDFLKATFDADVPYHATRPDGTVVHARVRIGDADVMLADVAPPWPAMPAMVHVYVPDADATYARAIAAGATSVMEPATHFYGDRAGGVRDAAGNVWWIATHVEDVPADEMCRRAAAHAKG